MLDQQNHEAVSRVAMLDRIEDHKGDDEYLQVLYQTPNSFTLSWPSHNRSITVDKRSLKTEEHDLFMSDTTEVVASDVCGFLGILPIYGLDHFVIARERQEVCQVPTYKQPVTNATVASLYALKKVELIPFFSQHKKDKTGPLIEEEKKGGAAQEEPRPNFDMEKIEEVVGKIKKYLEEGFYFAYNYDLTSNLQRQRKLYDQHGFQAKGMIQNNFSWNRNMFDKIQAQNVSKFWCTHLMQGFIDRQSTCEGKLDLVLIGRRGAERGGTRFLHRGIDENGYVANFVEFEQIVIRDEGQNTQLYSYAQIRGTFPFFWTQPNVSKFVIEKEIQAALPFFQDHMQMLFDRYTEEVPEGETKKIFSMNLVKDKEGDKERMLAEYYEQLLDLSKDKFKERGQVIGYSNFAWHAATKNGTQPFQDLLKSLDGEQGNQESNYLQQFGIYHETRNNFSKEGVVQSWQKGVVRTNCIDCLDRTNVAKMMTCQKAFNDFIWRDEEEVMDGFTDEEDRAQQAAARKQEVMRAMIMMWAYAGDIISKIYSGTPSVLTAVTLKGHEDLSDKFTHYMTSAHRWELQKFSDEFKHECIQILRGQHSSSVQSMQNQIEAVINHNMTTSMIEAQKCTMMVSTVNCHFRLPTAFDNLQQLFKNAKQDEDGNHTTVDIYCINLQQIVYRGARTIFDGDAEQAPGQAWLNAIPAQLKRANPGLESDYVCVASVIAYTTLTALFVRKPFVKQVYATNGPSVNLATGIGGRRCSKRGSVSLNFKVRDSQFRVVNMHLKAGSLAERLRDLSKVLAAHQSAIENQGCSVFLLGAVNFAETDDIQSKDKQAKNQGERQSRRDSCQIMSLKSPTTSMESPIPGITPDDERSKHINRAGILDMISHLEEGDIDGGVIDPVRNKSQDGLMSSLYNDRIFWLESNYIKNLDYDIKVADMPNPRDNRQFKCVSGLFNILGLEIDNDDKQKLLGKHFQLQKMHTQRSLDKDVIAQQEKKQQQIDEEDREESDDLGVEDLDMEEEKKEPAKLDVLDFPMNTEGDEEEKTLDTGLGFNMIDQVKAHDKGGSTGKNDNKSMSLNLDDLGYPDTRTSEKTNGNSTVNLAEIKEEPTQESIAASTETQLKTNEDTQAQAE